MKRGLFKTRAVVLNSFDFSESDRILTFCTEDYGKIKGVAKGARRSRRRFVNNLEPMCHIRLMFFNSEKSELVRVEDSALIEGFEGLRAGIESLSQACYLLELVSEMTREGQDLALVYRLLVDFLKMFDEGCEAEALSRFFEVRLLSSLGYLPHLEDCVMCKDDFGPGEAKAYFSSEKGGVVCRRCSGGLAGLLQVSPGTARFLSTAARFDSEKLKRLKPGAAFIDESERLLYDFIRYQLGKELKTKKFMSKLKAAAL